MMKCKGLKHRKKYTLTVSLIFEILLKVCVDATSKPGIYSVADLTRELACYSLKTSIETLRLYSNGAKLGLVLSSTVKLFRYVHIFIVLY